MVAKQAADKCIIKFEKDAGADVDIILIAIQEHVRLCVFYRCRKGLFLKDLLVPRNPDQNARQCVTRRALQLTRSAVFNRYCLSKEIISSKGSAAAEKTRKC